MNKEIYEFTVIGEKNNFECVETIMGRYCDCNANSEEQTDCIVLKEHKLDIFVEHKFLGYIVCSPMQLTALVVGHLITCEIIVSVQEIEKIVYNENNSVCRVSLKDTSPINIEHKEMITSGKNVQQFVKNEEEIIPTLQRIDVKMDDIKYLAEIFKADTPLHAATHGTHSCFLAYNSEILYMCEDLGRHNALDKVIGMGSINGINLKKCIVYTSGRVPLDMMNKVICAGIPIIVSNAVPTQEAISLAVKKNIILIGRTKPSGFIIYT